MKPAAFALLLCAACARPAEVFPRTVQDGCVVERVASVANEHHFSFRGLPPDGRRVVVGYSARGDSVRGSYLLDLRTGTRTPLSGINNGGSFSPDGKRIVAAVYGAPRRTRIVELDLATGDTVTVAPDSSQSFLPSYSPDGRWIVFNSYRTGRSDLYLYDRETRALRRLTTFDGYDAHAQFSPDGANVVFHRQTGASEYNLVLLALATGQERLLTTGSGEKAYPAFSPSGREIAYTDSRGGSASTDLHLLSLADGSSTRLLTLPTYEGYPAWSRDGRYLYFTSRGTGETALQRVRMNGTTCARP